MYTVSESRVLLEHLVPTPLSTCAQKEAWLQGSWDTVWLFFGRVEATPQSDAPSIEVSWSFPNLAFLAGVVKTSRRQAKLVVASRLNLIK